MHFCEHVAAAAHMQFETINQSVHDLNAVYLTCYDAVQLLTSVFYGDHYWMFVLMGWEELWA